MQGGSLLATIIVMFGLFCTRKLGLFPQYNTPLHHLTDTLDYHNFFCAIKD
jgi:hypothetical protein